MNTIQDQIVSEISGMPESELFDLFQLIRIFKASRYTGKADFRQTEQWRGGLKD